MAIGQCPKCGAIPPPGSVFCTTCGTALPNPAAAAGGAFPPALYPPSSGAGYPPYQPVMLVPTFSKDRERTVEGLIFMVIGFALGWIPYIDFIGGLLVLIGLILVYLGRRGYGPDHEHDATVGAVLIFLSILASFILAGALVIGILNAVQTPGATPSSVASALDSTLDDAFIGAVVVGVIGGVGQVVLVYALSDRTSRMLLWAGFVSATVLALVVALILLPEVTSAVTQATSGSTLNVGPINQIETTSTILGLTKVLPSALFALGYYRVREEALRRGRPPGPPNPSAYFGGS